MTPPTPKIYVDCDDTLIKWVWDVDEAGISLPVDHAEYNYELIDAVNTYRTAHPKTHLIVWSGGGADYAMRWAEKCFPDNKWGYGAKDLTYPTNIDICVDDQPLKVQAPQYTPEEFIDFMSTLEPLEKECDA